MELSKKGERKMKELVKRGVCVTLIYLVAILCTFVLTNRIERLEANEVLESEVALSVK